MILVDDGVPIQKLGISKSFCTVDVVENERGLFTKLIEKIRTLDPDLLMGYEIHSGSWGFLIERAKYAYGEYY